MNPNFTYQEHLANVQHGNATISLKSAGLVSQVTQGLSAWTIVFSLILAAVVYDQSR